MDAGNDDRRWYEEIERRLTQRFRGVYIAITAAGVCGFAMVHYALPRADGQLEWGLGISAALFALFGLLHGVRVLREHDARRALVRGGQRVPLQMPRIHRSVEGWRLEGRVFDAARGEFVECASDWQTPPPPVLDGGPLPPLLVDRAQPSRRWLPVGTLRTAGYAPGARQAA